MKKTILTLTFLTLSSSFAYSEEVEKSDLMEAPQSYVIDLLNDCKDYARDEAIDKTNLNRYLLSCINEELGYGNYSPIKVLPKG